LKPPLVVSTGAGESSGLAPHATGGGSFWKKRGLYLLGILLVYIGVSWSFAIGYSSITEIRWSVGCVMGPIIATPLAGLHLVLQWLLRKLVRRFAALRPLHEGLVLNAPVAALMCVWVVGAYRGTAAKPVFERFVTKPIPSSVRIVSHGGGQENFAEGARIGIWFEIEPGQRCDLIRTGGFTATADDHGAEYWKGQFWYFARVEIPLAAPYEVYFRESRPRTNEMKFSYTEGAHTTRDIVKSVQYDVTEYLFCPANGLSVFYLRLAK
jgi:hypothetical protein